jgi:DNA ligase-1
VPDATLLEFARVNDAAAATTRKLEKQAILAAYLRAIGSDDDLRRAVRYAAGRAFAATDERTLNVGGALVSDVVLALLKLDPGTYADLVRRSGESGEALSAVWASRPPRDDGHADPLTLHAIAQAFDDLAAAGSWETRREVLFALFTRCATGREAAYLAKVIFGDLRTGVQEGVLHAAIAEAFARDGEAVRRCHLLVGDLGEVAVLARHDACATATFRLFHPIQFMLAAPQESAEAAAATMDGRAFFAEDKLDGVRAQVHKSGDRVAIYTRTMDRTDASFPDVADAIRTLPGDLLLDGEIVPYEHGQVLPFAHIQKRLGRKVLTAKILRDNPAVFIAFDVLYRDGVLLMDLPLRERRQVLEHLAGVPAANVEVRTPPPGTPAQGGGKGAARGMGGPPMSSIKEKNMGEPPMPRSPHVVESGAIDSVESSLTPRLLLTRHATVVTAADIDAAFARARDARNEGLVLKDPDSPYSPGRRGQMWLKIKTHLPTLDCVVTAAEYGHGKRRNSLSDYTFAIWDRDPADPAARLVNVGKAYSGVTDQEIRQLTELFLKLAIAQRGRVYEVEPKVVLEIACDQIQQSNRHASGFALRFPRIVRIRWDKHPNEADRLDRVRELFQSFSNTAHPTRAKPAEAPEPTLFDRL